MTSNDSTRTYIGTYSIPVREPQFQVSYPTSHGEMAPIRIGNWVSHLNNSGSTVSSLITGLNPDGFETKEYSCGFWNTQCYPYDSLIEIIHDGVEFQKPNYDQAHNRKACLNKEFIMKIDESRKIPAEIGSHIQIFPHNDGPDARIINIYHVHTCLETKPIYVIERIDMKITEHLERSQFIVHI